MMAHQRAPDWMHGRTTRLALAASVIVFLGLTAWSAALAAPQVQWAWRPGMPLYCDSVESAKAYHGYWEGEPL